MFKEFQILHFNDAYEVEKSPTFAQQYMQYNTPETLRLFSGDILNPSLVSIFEKGKQFIPFFHKVQPQYSCVGNHDLDFGEQHFLDLAPKFATKWLLSNFKRKGQDVNIGNALEFDFYFIGSIKIGIFGLMDKNWISASSLNASLYEYVDFIEKGRELSRMLKLFGCDYVIALTHMSTVSDEALLADPESRIDLILGGHDHLYAVKRVNNRILVKSGSNFDYFTKIVVKLYNKARVSVTHVENDTPVEKTGPLIKARYSYNLNNANKNDAKRGIFITENPGFHITTEYQRYELDTLYGVDEDLQAHLDSVMDDINKKTHTPVLKLLCSYDITFNHVRRNPSKMGMLLADLLRIRIRSNIMMVNGGHMRSEQVYPPDYTFRLLDVFKLLPIFNTYKVLKAKGSDLKMLIEQGFQNLPRAFGGFPNFSGIKVSINTFYPPLQRIEEGSLCINGKPIADDGIYTISTSEFLAEGKDGYTKFLDMDPQDFAEEIYTVHVLQEFIRLPQSARNRDEFQFFKKHDGHYSIDFLNDLYDSVASKIYAEFNESNLGAEGGSVDGLISKVDLDCLKRIQMYTQAESITVIEGEHVFVLNGEQPTDTYIIHNSLATGFV